MWDQRFAKRFKIGDKQAIEAYYELYNTLNTHAVTGQGTTIGTTTFLGKDGSLYNPTDIVSREFRKSM